jgi:hypothetical protein
MQGRITINRKAAATRKSCMGRALISVKKLVGFSTD